MEDSFLLDRKYDDDYQRKLYNNFVAMCLAFSANHGSVVACLAYASAELGDRLGGYGSGTLYVCYALTAFLLSKPVVAMIGPKNGLLAGVGGYCLYVVGFLLAVALDGDANANARWFLFISACVIGGTAGGLLWTAQGRYFANNAKQYAQCSAAASASASSSSSEGPMTVEQANATFAGVFAASYLGLEVVTKVLATVVFVSSEAQAPLVVFGLYTAIAFVAVFFIAGLDDLGERGTWDLDWSAIGGNAAAAGTMIVTEPRLALLVPFQLAFGFASSFVPYYVFGTVVGDSDELGGKFIGLLSATIALTGAVTAVPAGLVANRFGKTLPMTVGGLCLVLAGVAFLLFSDAQLGTWSAIVPYLIIYGVGRGTWENTNKALVADFFSSSASHSTAAFAAISFTSGISGAFGYFMWPSLPIEATAYIIALTSAAGIAGLFLAVSIHRHGMAHPDY